MSTASSATAATGATVTLGWLLSCLSRPCLGAISAASLPILPACPVCALTLCGRSLVLFALPPAFSLSGAPALCVPQPPFLLLAQLLLLVAYFSGLGRAHRAQRPAQRQCGHL